MTYCFHHTDLGQNAVFHNFAIQDDRRTRGLLAKLLKNFPKSPIRPAAGSQFCSASRGEYLNEH